MSRPFRQVDVFAPGPQPGNPVAVVHDADGLTDHQMQTFAHWTNLSETTFLLGPTQPGADYRVRIFTPKRELPFAGHPTLGTAHAWLEAGGRPGAENGLVQETAAGLITVRRSDDALFFAAPPLLRDEPADESTRSTVAQLLDIDVARIEAMRWIDNGPGWVGVVLPSADDVLALRPRMGEIGENRLKIGVVGFFDSPDSPATVEVRAFGAGDGSQEDPVTGSLNAGLAQWMIREGRAPASYVARQGTALGRRGMVRVEADGENVWVGGATRTIIKGSVDPLG